MTRVTRRQSGALIELRPGHARVAPDAGVSARAADASVPGLSNVIPFLRPRGAQTEAPAVALPADAARLSKQPLAGERARLAAFLTLSLAVHGSLFVYFWREPEPLASIGIEVISAELVLGATAPAGIAPTRGEAELNAAAAATDPQQTDPQREAEQKATEQVQDVQVAREETAPEQTTTLERQADEQRPDDNEAAPREQRQLAEAKPAAAAATHAASREETAPEQSTALERQADEPQPADNKAMPRERPVESKPAVAMVEGPDPEMATAIPREIPPDARDVSLLPQPEEKPVEAAEAKPEPKPVQKRSEPKPVQAAPKPVKNAARDKERRRIDAQTRDKAAREARASTASTAANNVGVGRSSNATNYRGLVSAHLARYKQYPSDARSRGDGGTATVTFSLSGGGGVTSVRLARGSGVASIDQEAQAMVRRASPFPAPPDGRPVSFTVPVSFRVN